MTGAVFARPPSSDFAAELFERRLAETVERAFAPDPRMLAVTRRQLVRRFRVAPIQATAPKPRHFIVIPRSIATGAAAAAVVLAGTGIAAANDGAGQPFYAVRLTVESLTLPAVGTSARAVADLNRLDERLVEAQAGVARGDAAEYNAALSAYRTELADVQVAVAAHDSGSFVMANRLRSQRTALAGLVGDVPAQSAGLVHDVVTQVDGVVDSLITPPTNRDGKEKGNAGGNGNRTDGTASSQIVVVGAPVNNDLHSVTTAPGQPKVDEKDNAPGQTKTAADPAQPTPADLTADAAPVDVATDVPAATTTKHKAQDPATAPGQLKKVDAIMPASSDATVAAADTTPADTPLADTPPAETAADVAPSDTPHGKANGRKK